MGRRGRPRHPDILTPREWEVLELLRQRQSNEQIAQRLGITLDGAKYHVSQILSKLGVGTREEAASLLFKEGRRWWASWPLWARIAGVGTIAAAVAGLAVLTWGVLRTSGDESSLAGGTAGRAVGDSPVCGVSLAPAEKAGPLKMRFGSGTVCWTDVDNEASYKVEGTVHYLSGGCPHTGAPGSEDIPFSVILAANSTSFTLPRPQDPRLTFANAVTVSVEALDASGATLLTDGTGLLQRDDFCQPSPTP